MVRIEYKGIKKLLDYLTDLYFEDETKYPFNIWFGDDMEPNALTLYELIYRQLNQKLNSLDLYLEKSDVIFGENTDFEISDKTIKMLTEKISKKMETPAGKNDIEYAFGGAIDTELTMRDVAKFLVRQIEMIVLYTFEFDDFLRYIAF